MVAPICNDQFHQVRFIAASGVGGHLPLDTISTTTLSDTIQQTRQSETIKAACRRVSASYQLNGAGRAAELVVQL